MKISVASLNFKKAALSVRSCFQFTKDELGEVYKHLKYKNGLAGLVIFSTCNRTEIYLNHNSLLTIYDVLEYLQDYKQVNLPLNHFEFIEDNRAAVAYMMEVANGLHSMAFGDKQVFGQIKEAFMVSQRHHTITGLMERIFQAIFRSHKRITKETAYHQGSQSISYLAVNAIRKKYRGSNIPVLIIGAGEIAADLIKYFSSMSFTNVTVINRTSSKAVSLAERYQYQFADYCLSPGFLTRFSVIISCAASKDILDAGKLAELQQIVFIDLTTFRSIIPPKSKANMLTLDHLNLLKENTSDEQLKATEQVRGIIAEEAITFFDWMATRLKLTYQKQAAKAA
ncbi:hypothetical protein [Pedobacter borealis]|uniref:hypothetical protein n=1 Tax=Pedobacter borealis TaxID=475254 RepID=UPI0004931153|nr:hypothetical protein [Pedobacter borealis]